MAQDIVGGLFGIQNQPDYSAQDYRNAMAMAELGKAGMGRFVGGMLGSQLGRAAGGAVGGLLGIEDPRLKRQKLIAAAQQQGLDPSTPQGAKQIAEFFRQNGDLELATRASLLGDQMMESQATVTAKMREQLPTAAKELIAAGYKQGTPEFEAKMREIVQAGITGKAKGDGVNVNLGGFVGKILNKEAAAKEGEEIGKQITAWGKVAANAPQSLQTANTAIDLIDKAFTGAGAESLMNLSKFARQVGVPVSDKASNTEISVALTKKLISEQGRTFPGSQSNLELQQILQKNPNALQEPRTQRYLWDLYKQDVRTAKESYRSAQEHKQKSGSYAGYDVYQGGAQASQSIIDKTNRYNQLSQKARTTGTLTPQEAREAKQLEADLGENR